MPSKQLTKTKTIKKFTSHFYGVYLLCSQSPEKRFSGKCYIGFTVNPNRRIKQHNQGADFGGAKKTNNKGPWKMVIIVHGFPNNVSALQFEWAWQQPSLSSRLKCFPELKKKMSKETYFQYNFRILSRMLNIGPWQRLPLVIRWLDNDYECEFDQPFTLPKHMQIVNGFLTIEKPYKKQEPEEPLCTIWTPECHLCMEKIENGGQSLIGCLNSICKLTCHIICLANHLLSSERGHYIPIEGDCPSCETNILWIELLKRKRLIQCRFTEKHDCCDDVDSDLDHELLHLDSSISFSQHIDAFPESSSIYEISD